MNSDLKLDGTTPEIPAQQQTLASSLSYHAVIAETFRGNDELISQVGVGDGGEGQSLDGQWLALKPPDKVSQSRWLALNMLNRLCDTLWGCMGGAIVTGEY